ncbi:FixH family protein [Halobacillus sp. B23F22_1]|uniref:FixH family protein n=1 Tax=Halobacillus sp. B23F22_1 TaxID=3459514 RepID=UPI00373EA28C
MIKHLIIFTCIILLAACGTSQDNESASEEDTEIVQPEVEVVFEDEPLPISEETSIQAIVTADDEPIIDADYVEFEIWNEAEGEEESETIEAEHQEEGLYEIDYTFEESGTYQVIAHTQARDVHTMPQVEVQVGDKKQTGHEHDMEEESNHDHGKNEFTVHLMKEEDFLSNEDSELLTHIEQDGKPFEEGEVSFEISSDHLDKHEFIDAEEGESGAYRAAFTFPSAGEYLINVHYEKPNEEIHGHKEEEISVN